MPDEQELLTKARKFSSKIQSYAHDNANILLVAHHDADGICGASILTEYILRQGGHNTVRPVSDLTPRSLEKLSQTKFGLIAFIDIGSGLASEISRLFGDKWLIIDHYEIGEVEKDSEHILNPWQFGIDGSNEISSSGLCYFIIEQAHNINSAFFAITGALSDGQDVGPRKTLVGLNSKILEDDASTFKEIRTRSDLLLYGRDTRPAHEALADTAIWYIPGLTANKDACLASLRGAEISIKSSTRWKTVSDFNEDEKRQVLNAIAPHLTSTTNTVEDLVGTVYTLGSEDEYSFMHDARDFAMLLNACGRMGKAGLGLSMCMGDGGDLPSEADQVFSEYRTELVRAVQTLTSSADRIIEKPQYSFVVGDGVVSERMTGAVCRVLSTLNRNRTKVVLLRTTTSDGDVRVSARSGKDTANCDLGLLLRESTGQAQGIGGGNPKRASGRFSIARQQEFLSAVDEIFQSAK